MTPAFAQNAQIGGRVIDPPGAVIPATITLSSSNEEGYFAIPALQPGQYKLTAQKEGFKPLNHGGIVV